jgi:hypothetical protein
MDEMDQSLRIIEQCVDRLACPDCLLLVGWTRVLAS